MPYLNSIADNPELLPLLSGAIRGSLTEIDPKVLENIPKDQAACFVEMLKEVYAQAWHKKAFAEVSALFTTPPVTVPIENTEQQAVPVKVHSKAKKPKLQHAETTTAH